MKIMFSLFSGFRLSDQNMEKPENRAAGNTHITQDLQQLRGQDQY